MKEAKLSAGAEFPSVRVNKLGGGELLLGKPAQGMDWQLVVVYRGAHCPLCTRYLKELAVSLDKFKALSIDVVAVSADPIEKAQSQLCGLNLGFDVGCDLETFQMQLLGLYVSEPRSPEETDRPFSEPALFLVNEQNQIQVLDYANAPFVRPELSVLLSGLAFIRNPDNHYPIRGALLSPQAVNHG